MQKRGQVSVFVIIGIVLVIVVALLWFLRSEVGVGVPPLQYLDTKSQPVQENVRECVFEFLQPNLVTFSHQGGFFVAPHSFLYQGFSVPFYCTNIPGKEACLNVMPSLDHLERNLNFYLQEHVRKCVEQPDSGLGYEVSDAELSSSLDTSRDNIIVTVNYPVMFSGKGSQTTLEPMTFIVDDAPLREVYEVAHDIVQAQAQDGRFYQDIYMLDHKGLYEINVDKPFPHTLYKINKKNSAFSFWIAVEGESS